MLDIVILAYTFILVNIHIADVAEWSRALEIRL
jgi:hypothetical protein